MSPRGSGVICVDETFGFEYSTVLDVTIPWSTPISEITGAGVFCGAAGTGGGEYGVDGLFVFVSVLTGVPATELSLVEAGNELK